MELVSWYGLRSGADPYIFFMHGEDLWAEVNFVLFAGVCLDCTRRAYKDCHKPTWAILS